MSCDLRAQRKIKIAVSIIFYHAGHRFLGVYQAAMSTARELRELLRLRILQRTVLAFLFAFVVWRSLLLKLTVRDLDNWWHLKVGEWILHNHSFPHTGIFSATAANRPWAAYSWGYEVLLSLAFKWFDIVGMAVFGTILTVLVAASVYRLTQRLSGRFWIACLTATAACSVFLFTLCPRPVYFSMILFALELTLILEANRSGRIQPLYWLPAIFVLWANLHIQFIYGLAVVGLLLLSSIVHRLAHWTGRKWEWLSAAALPLGSLVTISAACVLAVCISPYSFHLYEIVYRYGTARFPYQLNRDMQPIAFQVPSHYLQLLLTGPAFFALGRERKLDVFKVPLLVLATVLGFRMMRDSWFLCITAAALISDSFTTDNEEHQPTRWHHVVALAAFLLLAGFLFARDTNFNREGLAAKISSMFPVDAVNYLRKHPHPGPLYNTYDWGGFLIWYMPELPVAIDGRNDLYGDELSAHFVSIANGADSYAYDPFLDSAGVILLQKEVPLASILQADPIFQKIYEDPLAVILVRHSMNGATQPGIP
jgi:hypothetical protein